MTTATPGSKPGRLRRVAAGSEPARNSLRRRASGTRNHFGLDLGLDRAKVPGLLTAYEDGAEHRSTRIETTTTELGNGL